MTGTAVARRGAPPRPADRWAAAMARAGVPALRMAAFAFPVVFMAVAAATYPIFADPTTIGSDSSNYYAAGQRLNDGHPLYALSPGDRPVPLVPPYWSIPLLAPPPIAVLWRTLALVGDASMILWWGASILAMVTTLAVAVRRSAPAPLAALIALSPAIGLTAVSGNANAFLVPALLAAWLLRDRAPLAAGGLIAIAAAVKLAPILLMAWLVLRPGPNGRRALAGVFGGGLVIGLVSLAGAGLGAHLDYLAAFRSTASGAPTPLSLPGLLLAAGAPDAIAGLSLPLLVGGALVAAFLLRADERRSFAVIAAAAALATPVVYFQTIALGVVALAPWLFRPARTAAVTPPIAGGAGAGGWPA